MSYRWAALQARRVLDGVVVLWIFAVLLTTAVWGGLWLLLQWLRWFVNPILDAVAWLVRVFGWKNGQWL